ncbi:MAG: ABC transporter substrate-binding protein [Mariprofundaceae bacterium]
MKRYVILFFLCLLTACQQPPASTTALKVGLAQLPMSIDPRFATDAASHKVQELLHRGLVHLDDAFLPQPDVALSWSHPDALTWDFDLRTDVQFHDGSRLTAADAVATLQALLDDQISSPLKAGFAAIKSLEVLTPTSLRIHLNRPDSSLLTRLSLGIVPKAWAQKKHQARSMPGCGLFKLHTWKGNRMVLERVQASPVSNINTIELIRVKDAVTRSLKLVRGEIDFAQNDLPADLLPYLQSQAHLKIQSRASTNFSYIGLNLQDDILKDVRVRRALALAVDRKRLKKALLSDLPVLAETVLSPAHWASQPLELLQFDADKAEALLDAAGFRRDQNGIRFKLIYRTSTDPFRLRLTTAIADMWQKIGVEVSIESLEWGGFYARIKRGDFQVFSLAWVGIVDPDIYRWILHSSMWPPKGANRGRYSQLKVDQWLDQAAVSENIDQRRALYHQIEQQMQHDQVYIPLWYEPVVAVFSERLHGFKLASDGSILGLAEAYLSD